MRRREHKFYLISLLIFIVSLSIFVLTLFDKHKMWISNNLSKNKINLSNYQEAANISADENFLSFSLPFLNTKKLFHFPDSLSSDFVILIFFTPFDCSSCLTEIPFWNNLNSYKKYFDVIGIISFDNFKEAKKFVSASDINIPVLFDSAGSLTQALPFITFGSTPLKILVNKNGEILNISSSTYNKMILQKKYLQDILKAVEN